MFAVRRQLYDGEREIEWHDFAHGIAPVQRLRIPRRARLFESNVSTISHIVQVALLYEMERTLTLSRSRSAIRVAGTMHNLSNPRHLLTAPELASLAVLGDQSADGNPDGDSVPGDHRDKLVSLGFLTAPHAGILQLTADGWQFLIDHG